MKTTKTGVRQLMTVAAMATLTLAGTIVWLITAGQVEMTDPAHGHLCIVQQSGSSICGPRVVARGTLVPDMAGEVLCANPAARHSSWCASVGVRASAEPSTGARNDKFFAELETARAHAEWCRGQAIFQLDCVP